MIGDPLPNTARRGRRRLFPFPYSPFFFFSFLKFHFPVRFCHMVVGYSKIFCLFRSGSSPCSSVRHIHPGPDHVPPYYSQISPKRSSLVRGNCKQRHSSVFGSFSERILRPSISRVFPNVKSIISHFGSICAERCKSCGRTSPPV